jgi:hypothetical protein
VVDALLRSGKWRVRGLSRNIESDQAKALASKGVEMVQCHVNNPEQLAGAFKVRFFPLYPPPVSKTLRSHALDG